MAEAEGFGAREGSGRWGEDWVVGGEEEDYAG